MEQLKVKMAAKMFGRKSIKEQPLTTTTGSSFGCSPLEMLFDLVECSSNFLPLLLSAPCSIQVECGRYVLRRNRRT